MRFNLEAEKFLSESESIYCDMFENDRLDDFKLDQINDLKLTERESDILTPLAVQFPLKQESDISEFESDSISDFKSADLNTSEEKQTFDIAAPILRVHLENQTIKSFKYDKNTCVRDVLNCLKEKLAINYIENYALVLRLNNHNCVSSFVLLEETRHLCKLNEQYGCGDSNYHCMFRYLFMPSSYQYLIINDENSFDYLYEQVQLKF